MVIIWKRARGLTVCEVFSAVPRRCLSEKGPLWAHIFENSSPRGAVWGGCGPLGGGALLEEIHHCGLALKAYGLAPHPVLSFCFLFVS